VVQFDKNDFQPQNYPGRISMTTPFIAPYTVTIGDINYGRHLGNDRALLIFQEARIRFLESFGLSEGNIGEGRSLVVVEVGCRYLREIFLHDELAVQVTLGGIEGKKATFQFVVTRKGDGQQVLTGFTAILAIDPALRKVVELPQPFLAACRQ
jgi:acyl-CoA thioester hydrolase